MKKYNTPEAYVIALSNTDVIMTSGLEEQPVTADGEFLTAAPNAWFLG